MCKYMAQPIDQEWFDKVKDDTWNYNKNSTTWSEDDINRDHLLTDAIHIEVINVDNDGNMVALMGS